MLGQEIALQLDAQIFECRFRGLQRELRVEGLLLELRIAQFEDHRVGSDLRAGTQHEVVGVGEDDVGAIVKVFESDFYIDVDDVRSAVHSRSQFNLMHLKSGIKVDLIIRKAAEYRQIEFARRQQVNFAGVKTWIVTKEDLILSKLDWAKDSGSELQQRDVRSLMNDSVDRAYVEQWAKRLGVDALLRSVDDE